MGLHLAGDQSLPLIPNWEVLVALSRDKSPAEDLAGWEIAGNLRRNAGFCTWDGVHWWGTFLAGVGEPAGATVTQQLCLLHRALGRTWGLGASSGSTDWVIFCPRLLATGYRGVMGSQGLCSHDQPGPSHCPHCHPFPCLLPHTRARRCLGWGGWAGGVPPCRSTAQGTGVSALLCLSFPTGSAVGRCPKNMLITLPVATTLILGTGD